jgi:alkylation response protein AidB-like acyl-CoA dehydrogenase
VHSYQAPLRDLRFVIHDVLSFEQHYRAFGRDDLNNELLEGILEEGARFAENVLAPTNRVGDEHGLRFADGKVFTPPGFKAAYDRYCEDGWIAMTADPRWGGQGLPGGFALAFGEMLISGNMAWKMYSGLSESAALTIAAYGTEAQQNLYLPPMVSGRWSGTMCLTESHCGSDLGLLRTRAQPRGDGSYAITGTKIFISCGEHDLTQNIVHLVLARLPDAPPGTKGISLFIVPKYLPDAHGEAGTANGVRCGSVENKMGLHASPTCVMHFDEASGWLLGRPNEGLACMFTMMNHARLGVGLQGQGLSELAFQTSVAYAHNRLQGRASSGAKSLGKAADPIIAHADVRRMLLTQKALVEGGRVLCFLTAREIDCAELSPDPELRQQAHDLIAFLTPIVKAFLTDAALEVTSLAVQVHGGHGFIRETGVEQLSRDARITPIYEGTNGIQALDLLGRKVLGTGGRSQQMMAARMRGSIAEITADATAELRVLAEELERRVTQWDALTADLAQAAAADPDEIGAAAADYLQFSGYVCLAWCWLLSASAARRKSTATTIDAQFSVAKLQTARFGFARLLPRVDAHAAAARAGAAVLMDMTPEQFLIP